MPAAGKRAAARPYRFQEEIPHDASVEQWRNVTLGTAIIVRTGEFGRPVSELIPAGRTFTLTPQERRHMQNLASSPDMDLFTNGFLAPVSLIDDEPDTEFLLSNPNTISDSEITKLLRSRSQQFTERVEQITSLPAVTRMLEIARDPESPMTVWQYEVVKRHERTLRSRDANVIEPDDPDTATDEPKPVTPR